MAIRLSTGLRNAMLGTAGAKGTFESTVGFVIDVYSGTQPASADDAPVGTKLVTISNNSSGTYLQFDSAPDAGVLAKSPAQTWSGVAVATGVAGWFRVRKLDDAGGTSTTLPRYDGTCATSGAQMNLGNLSITSAATVTVPSATLTMAASA